MPELPEVQLVVDAINKSLSNRKIIGVNILWPGYLTAASPKKFIGALIGQSIRGAGRRGKFIIIHLDDYALLLHLRMTGKVLQLNNSDEPPAHTHVTFLLDNGKLIAFNDVRKFGRLELVEQKHLEERIARLHLGFEPLEPEFNAENLLDMLKGRQRSIKNILLDQNVVAGIGNIYACEILHDANINPFSSGDNISITEVQGLIKSTRKVLQFALSRGGSSISDYFHLNGDKGSMQNHFAVYGREGEPCERCGEVILRKVQVGRSTFWCPSCQK